MNRFLNRFQHGDEALRLERGHGGAAAWRKGLARRAPIWPGRLGLCLLLSAAAVQLARAADSAPSDPRTANPQAWLDALKKEWNATNTAPRTNALALTNSPALTNTPATNRPAGARASTLGAGTPGAGEVAAPGTGALRMERELTPAATNTPALTNARVLAPLSPSLTNAGAPARTTLSATNSPSLPDGAGSVAVLRDPQALAALMATLDDTQKFGAGDKVTYRVLEDQDETKPLTVSDAGDLDVPYLGLVPAAKKTCKQLAFEIKAQLEKRDYRRATVILSLQEINKKRVLGKVYVVGQVKLSGPLEIPDDEVFTVSKAILKAGGFSDFADKRKVKLIRAPAPGQEADKSTTIIINVSEIWEKGKTANDVPVQADDMIFVPKRNINI